MCRQTRCLSVRSDPTVTAIVCNAASPLLRAACAWRSTTSNGTFRSRRRDSSQSHFLNLCVYSVLNMFTSLHDARSASTNEKHASQRRKHFVLSCDAVTRRADARSHISSDSRAKPALIVSVPLWITMGGNAIMSSDIQRSIRQQKNTTKDKSQLTCDSV